MKLSIITINRNNIDGLRKTIESVVSQTFKDFEFIIIDGASTDGDVDLIREYNASISYWVSEPDKGIYNAMNKGIKRATGEYCLFLNSGDWLYNAHVLEDAFSKNFTEDIFYGAVVDYYSESNFTEVEFPDEKLIDIDWFMHASIPHAATFIKRELFERYGLYSECYKIVSDWEFFTLVICKNNCSIKKNRMVMINYDRSGISSDLSNMDMINKERMLVWQKNFPKVYLPYFELLDIKQQLNSYKSTFFFKIYKRYKRFFKK